LPDFATNHPFLNANRSWCWSNREVNLKAHLPGRNILCLTTCEDSALKRVRRWGDVDSYFSPCATDALLYMPHMSRTSSKTTRQMNHFQGSYFLHHLKRPHYCARS
jgi:hypothetical protein